MADRIKIKVPKGSAVRDPATKKLLPVGEWIEKTNSSFWQRRIKDGDVVLAGVIPEKLEEKPSFVKEKNDGRII